MLSLKIISILLEMIGSIIIALAVYFVHHDMIREHRLDEKVIRRMRLEQKLVVFGIGFLSLGFILQIYCFSL